MDRPRRSRHPRSSTPPRHLPEARPNRSRRTPSRRLPSRFSDSCSSVSESSGSGGHGSPFDKARIRSWKRHTTNTVIPTEIARATRSRTGPISAKSHAITLRSNSIVRGGAATRATRRRPVRMPPTPSRFASSLTPSGGSRRIRSPVNRSESHQLSPERGPSRSPAASEVTTGVIRYCHQRRLMASHDLETLSLRSAVTLSRPGPQSMRSLAPSFAATASLPAPATIRSAPVPPVSRSLPLPPSRESMPALPSIPFRPRRRCGHRPRCPGGHPTGRCRSGSTSRPPRGSSPAWFRVSCPA